LLKISLRSQIADYYKFKDTCMICAIILKFARHSIAMKTITNTDREFVCDITLPCFSALTPEETELVRESGFRSFFAVARTWPSRELSPPMLSSLSAVSRGSILRAATVATIISG
jgi:hypothetical protein